MYKQRCIDCDVDIHSSFYLRHLTSKKHLENLRKNVPENVQEAIENKINNLLLLTRDKN